jgi:hypothetical protein
LGYITFTLFALIILQLNEGLFPFFQQSIIWPLLGHAGTTYGTKVLLINFLLLIQFPFFAAALWFTGRIPIRNQNILGLSLLLTLLAAYTYSRKIPNIPVSERSFAKFDYLSAFIAQQSLQMMSFGLIGVCLVLQLYEFRYRKSLSDSRIITLSISVGALFQLYPSPDSYHVWWIAPVLLAGIPADTKQFIQKFASPVILIPLLALNSYHNLEVVSLERASYRSEIFSGMYGNNKGVDDALIAIQRIIPPRSAKFICVDGLFAANSNGYLANDVAYVNWAKHITNSEHQSPEYVVTCKPYQTFNFEKVTIWENSLVSIERISGVNQLG